MISFIKGLFAVDSVVNTATKIVDKIAGTDWTAKDKADFVLKYQELTKHQSPSRRFIALCVTAVWVLLTVSMALSYIAGNLLGSPEVLMIAKDMKMIMADLIREPFNLIIGFYFVIGTMNSFKK
ncbi:TMhelix containing protein [Vibrio phage 1.054.O._10N.261.52.A1]|nr:TMhelix containing protein [Vibrio phage 1.054.O._10N.261.52.A1]